VDTINLHKRRAIDITTECTFKGLEIGLVAVTGKLDAIGEAGSKIIHETS
jgi:hypothetical protein